MAESEELSSMSIHTPVNDVQIEFARQAKQEFEKQQYDNCISTMNKLTQNRTMDPKVIHNKGVAEFYQSKFTKIEEFKLCLSTVCHFVSIFIIFCMHFLQQSGIRITCRGVPDGGWHSIRKEKG